MWILMINNKIYEKLEFNEVIIIVCLICLEIL